MRFTLVVELSSQAEKLQFWRTQSALCYALATSYVSKLHAVYFTAGAFRMGIVNSLHRSNLSFHVFAPILKRTRFHRIGQQCTQPEPDIF